MAGEPIKVSVLAGGGLLMDGQPVTFQELEAAMEGATKETASVWYYRESAAGEPPAAAMEVMKLITRLRLPVRLSTRPDFSDSVTSTTPALDQMFAAMRQNAAQQHKMLILRPDGKHTAMPALDINASPPQAIAAVEKMLPSSTQRFVAVIGDTAWAAAPAPSLQAANQAIPFFGLLMGFASIGHAVWVFDATALPMVVSGCRAADVAIIDGARLGALSEGWQEAIKKVMRNPQILIHDRATYQLRKA